MSVQQLQPQWWVEMTDALRRKFGNDAIQHFESMVEDKMVYKHQILSDIDHGHWGTSYLLRALHRTPTCFSDDTFIRYFHFTLKSLIQGDEFHMHFSKKQETTAHESHNLFHTSLFDELSKLGYRRHDIRRIAWKANSLCLIYSRSTSQWHIGIIDKVTISLIDDQEWLHVQYGDRKVKKIQRFSPYLQPIVEEDEDIDHLIRQSVTHEAKTLYNISPSVKMNHNSKEPAYRKYFDLRFYGVDGPSKYRPHDALQIHKNIRPSLLTSKSTKLHRSSTIAELKHVIRDIYHIRPTTNIIIAYGDRIVSKQDSSKLHMFGITHNSLLVIAIGTKEYKTDEPEEEEDKNDPIVASDYTVCVRSSTGLDVVTQEQDVQLFKMPNCGHFMNKTSLFEFACSQLEERHTLGLTCPHLTMQDVEVRVDEEEGESYWLCSYCTYQNEMFEDICWMCDHARGPREVACSASWSYSLVKQILLFDNESEWHKANTLEVLLGRNKLQHEYHMQSCPKCHTCYTSNIKFDNLDFKHGTCRDLATVCVRCSYKKHKIMEFCFGCGVLWEDNHVCDSSFKKELLKILKEADTKSIGDVDDVPTVRACPKCAQLIIHTEACKHMSCTSCHEEFCFVCLLPMVDDEWQCGSSGDVCPVADRQTLDTLPNSYAITKQSFQMF